jgi:uncharacterized membrane protein HdeD (DUF308 family)
MTTTLLKPLPGTLSHAQWTWLAYRGILAILFGILAFAWPGATLATLAIVWGAYAVVDGLFALTYGTRGGQARRWTFILSGLVGVVAGLIALFFPAVTALAFIMVLSVWAVVIGVMEVCYAIQHREGGSHPWLVGVSGLLSIAIGVFVFAYPVASAISLVWVIGAYAVVYGITMLAAAFKLRSLQHAHAA